MHIVGVLVLILIVLILILIVLICIWLDYNADPPQRIGTLRGDITRLWVWVQ
jgi:hypothetical protein